MRSTTFLTTALQVGSLLTAAEAARPRRRQAPGYGANGDAVQWGAWSATTFQTVTTPYQPTYQSWAATSTPAYKPPYNEEGNEEWNNWEEDEYTTKKTLVIPTPYNPLSTTTTNGYQSWVNAPQQYVTTEQYNTWQQAKPSPTTFMYQSWAGTSKRYDGDDEEYQGWQQASTKTPEVYQTWSQTMTTPTETYNSWQATPTHVISYSTLVITVSEYQTWSQASSSTEAYQTWSETSTAPAYQTWSQAMPTPTKPAEQVQEWAQWQGQQGNGNGYQNGQGNGNGYQNGNGPYSFASTTTPFINIPTNPAGAAAGAGAGAGLGGGLGGAGGLPGLSGLGGLPGLGALPGGL